MQAGIQINGSRFQFLGRRQTAMIVRNRGSSRNRRQLLSHRHRAHDPMLVFNMSVFNSGGGWDRNFNPFKVHQNGAS